GLGAGFGLAHDLHVLLGVDDHREPATDERLVVGDEDGDHGSALSGRRARTQKPPAGSGPAWSSPPNSATRSRIPTRPWPPPTPLPAPEPSSAISTSSASSP